MVLLHIGFELFLVLGLCKMLGGDRKKMLLYNFTGCIFLMVVLRCLGFCAFWYNTILCIPFGMLFVEYENRFKGLFSRYSFIIITAIIVALLFLEFSSFAVLEILLKLVKLLMYFPLIALSVVIVIYMTGGAHGRIMLFLGNISYEIYLLHGIFLDVFYKILPDLNIIQSLGILVGVIISTVISAILLHNLCNRIACKYLPIT